MNPTGRRGGTLLPAGLFFAIPALVLTARALASAGRRVCAGAAPDTWLHLWAFWRSGYAVSGRDHGYWTTHTLTYPGFLHELSAVFDPLLPWMSLPLQAAGCSIPTAYNILVCAGIVFSCMAGYLLCASLTSNRGAGLVGGAVMGLNPFLFRLLARGYAEYAWWGVVPFALWCLLEVARRPDRRRSIAYGAALLMLFLLSIYCSAYFLILALGVTWREFRRPAADRLARLKTLVRVHGTGALFLAPLFAVWAACMIHTGLKGIPYGRPFPACEPCPLHPREAGVAPEPGPAGEVPPGACPPGNVANEQASRTLSGSLDVHNLISLSPSRVQVEQARNALHFLQERTHLGEWWFILLLAACAFTERGRRASNTRWLAAAGVFLLLSLGPCPIWKETVIGRIPLPYAWGYQWIPGFARLAVPGRAVLGASLAIAVLASRGTAVIVRWIHHGSPAVPPALAAPGLAVAVFVFFMVAGYGAASLPTASTTVPAAYEHIRNDRDAVALIELPRRGDLAFRTFCQTVHGKPIFGGEFPMEWVDVYGMTDVHTNALVRHLEQPDLREPDALPTTAALAALRGLGFHYLLLHADGYERPDDWDAACASMEALSGPPLFQDTNLRTWWLDSLQGRGSDAPTAPTARNPVAPQTLEVEMRDGYYSRGVGWPRKSDGT